MKRLLFALLFVSACVPPKPVPPPVPDPPTPPIITGRDDEFILTCRAIYLKEVGRDITNAELVW